MHIYNGKHNYKASRESFPFTHTHKHTMRVFKGEMHVLFWLQRFSVKPPMTPWACQFIKTFTKTFPFSEVCDTRSCQVQTQMLELKGTLTQSKSSLSYKPQVTWSCGLDTFASPLGLLIPKHGTSFLGREEANIVSSMPSTSRRSCW